jgi:non-specific serine/threonine protein kinase
MSAALDWSYRTLSARDQVVFRRLSVFMGGFDLAAAEALAVETGDMVVLDRLSSLVDKALVSFVPTTFGGPRYRLTDTVRSYAREQLAAAGEIAEVERAHARYYLAVVEREQAGSSSAGYFVSSRPPRISGSAEQQRLPWPAVLDQDYPNLRAALIWAREREPNTFMRLATGLARYWWVRGRLQEGTEWLEEALSRNPGAEPELRSRALGGLGIVCRQSGQLDRAGQALEEAISLARDSAAVGILGPQLIDLAGVRGLQHRLVDAIAHLEEALDLARASGDAWAEAIALTYVAWRDILLGDGEAATARLAESLALLDLLGDVRSSCIVAMTLAWSVPPGDIQSILPYLENAVRQSGELGDESVIALGLEATASALGPSLDPAASARLLGAAQALRAEGHARGTIEQRAVEELLAEIRRTIGEDTLVDALREGARLSADDAVLEATTLLRLGVSLNGGTDGEPSGHGRDHLTEREQEIVPLLAEGCSNREIGERLFISENTAKYHVASILRKLGVASRAAAVAEAVNRGLLLDGESSPGRFH